MIIFGFSLIAFLFLRAYRNFIITQNELEIVERREIIRRSVVQQKPIIKRETYHNLNLPNQKLHELVFVKDLSQSVEEFKSILKTEFVRSSFSDVERESLLRSDNAFIMSEHRNKRFSLDFVS